jgi:sodium/hydrogen antiporter
VDPYDVVITLVGLTAVGAAVLPQLLKGRPLSAPVVYLAVGLVAFGPLLGVVEVPHPLDAPHLVERLAELAVIIALMGAGLKLDRVVGLREWASTWRLLAITMPLSILAAAALGYWALGLAPAGAVLLGAVIAPTDPVLAADVQVGGPGEGEETEVRFALTSEAGLNDGLAFPFTNAAIAMAVAGAAPAAWVGRWLAVDVVYKLAVGVIAGILIGRVLARIVFGLPERIRPADYTDGFVALAGTLLAYGLTELAGGYGFISVFVCGYVLRDHERHHEYHRHLHDFTEQMERILTIGLLILLGGAVAGGLLRPLGVADVVVGLALLLAVRPVAGMVGLAGFRARVAERGVIAFFGIRGIGSIYYLAHGLNEAPFADAERIWALVGFVVVASVLLHGITAGPVMRAIERPDQSGA